MGILSRASHFSFSPPFLLKLIGEKLTACDFTEKSKSVGNVLTVTELSDRSERVEFYKNSTGHKRWCTDQTYDQLLCTMGKGRFYCSTVVPVKPLEPVKLCVCEGGSDQTLSTRGRVLCD